MTHERDEKHQTEVVILYAWKRFRRKTTRHVLESGYFKRKICRLVAKDVAYGISQPKSTLEDGDCYVGMCYNGATGIVVFSVFSADKHTLTAGEVEDMKNIL